MTRLDLHSVLRLYLVADPDQCAGDLVSAVASALANGTTAVQLRAKSTTDREHVQLGQRLRELTREYGVPLLVNDRVDIALAVEADGVHVGVDDIQPADVRRLAPSDFVIGYSPDFVADIAGAEADYLGIGPVYGTSSKADAGETLGADTFASRVASVTVPVVGIGGITASNARAVLDAGAAGVAVISSILRSDDPGSASRAIREALDHPES